MTHIEFPMVVVPPAEGGPTYDGFLQWVENVMQVPGEAWPPTDAIFQTVYCQALNLAYDGLATVPSNCTWTSVYAQAVYNLGGAILVEYAQDNPNSTYWQDLRNKLNINSFIPGFINQAHDQVTGEGTYILKQLEYLTLWGLQLIKTPWGRAYLAFAGQWGPIWGLT